jgi:hypothetical protein
LISVGSIAFLLFVFESGLLLHADAASLNYPSPININLSSPATTLTIASGSGTDFLTVNATSVMVTLSSSTRGTFTSNFQHTHIHSVGGISKGGGHRAAIWVLRLEDACVPVRGTEEVWAETGLAGAA